jgi:two-component system, NarL family, nitrate/nitrite response regulator NarL
MTNGNGSADRHHVRVLIVDDHNLFADVLKCALGRAGLGEIDIVTRADEALARARSDPPDLVLLDIGLPDQSGLALGRCLIQEIPGCRVVAVTVLADRKTVDEAIGLGFSGYITKDTPIAEFHSMIEDVLNGNVVLPRRMGNGTKIRVRTNDPAMDLLIGRLTVREREVVSLLTEGLSGEDLAQRLSVSPNTVRTHIQNILSKLQVHSRHGAAAFAVRYGLTRTPSPVGWP